MYETLGIDLGKGYMSEVQSSTGENMDALGQVTCTFKNNGTQFTQAFIVCRNMTQHMILGTDFTATNFVDVIWTREGTRKLMDSNGRTIMELPDSTTKVPLVLAYSVKIEPRGQRAVPLECTRKLTDQMDIRIDAGFHHRNPNVHIPPSCVHDPENAFDPKYIPPTIFNLSHVDHLYIGSVVLLHCGCLSLNPFIEFSIRNNSSSSDVLNIQASISISPKYESQIKDSKSLSFTVT